MLPTTFFNIHKFKKKLNTQYIGKKIIYFKEIDSTNSYASRLEKELFNQKNNPGKELDGTVILSEIQTKGRGRFNRTWVSPQGGLWFTIILKSNINENHLPNITLLSAISITEILEKDYNLEVNIKWPNDINYKGFKICGILTETKKINDSIFLNIGIGINVNIETENLIKVNGKTKSIKDIIGKTVSREILLAKILARLESNYQYYINTNDFNKIFSKVKNNITYD